MSWQACIDRYDRPGTLFFLDPPYWQVEGYGTVFGLDQYEELTPTMACIKGHAILTINDHPGMRRRFDRFEGRTVVKYTIGGAAVARRERIYQT